MRVDDLSNCTSDEHKEGLNRMRSIKINQPATQLLTCSPILTVLLINAFVIDRQLT